MADNANDQEGNCRKTDKLQVRVLLGNVRFIQTKRVLEFI
jgi:hypothetical protein